MTDDALTYADSVRARVGESLWHEVVDLVAEWLCLNADEYEDSADGAYGEVLAQAWREEMA